jgi:transcriptional regulator with XRE-family HTH domain
MEEKVPMTMKDIAKEFGISVATVSRALKDSPRISEERRKAIQQFAREHNFYPNAIGEALRHSRVMPQRVIGVIVPEFTHYYFSSILTGIEEAAAARGFRIMVALSGEQYEREVRICENFLRYKVCGVIVSQAKDTKDYAHYQKLIDAGCIVRAYDPIAMNECKRRIGDQIVYCRDMYDAVLDADALLLLTEWKEFRLPGWGVIRKAMRRPLVIDGRNIFDIEELEENNFEYHCIGK